MADALILAADTVVADGSEPLKSLAAPDAGTLRVGAYAVRFADSSEKDLSGEYFTAKTDFGPSAGDGVATMFNHGMIPAKGMEAVFGQVCEQTFPPVKVTRDDTGLFVETTLDLSDKYQAAIGRLVSQGKLKWSSGSSQHVKRRADDGEITRWHPVEFSFTPTPCEPRLPAIRPLKSVEASPGLAAELAAGFRDLLAAHDPAAAVDKPAPGNSQTTLKSSTPHVSIMTPEEQQIQIDNAVKARNLENTEILAIGKQFNCSEAAHQFVAATKSKHEFMDHVLKNVVKADPVNPSTRKIGMSDKDKGRYSIVKAIRDCYEGGGRKGLTGLEKEASDATAEALKKSPEGFFIPPDIAESNLAESRDLGTEAIKALTDVIKTLNQTTFSQGGALVGTNILTGSIIELLRNKPLVSQMGAMTLTGLVGNVAIPRITGGASCYWLSEQGPATASDQAFGQIGFQPKRLAARTGYTKELINQTDISVEALVRNDLTTVMAIEKDRAALFGNGGAQPLGIFNTTGIGSVTFGGTASRAKLIQFQQIVATANASRGNLAYMTSPAASAKLLNVPVAPNYPTFLWEGNIDSGNMVGRRSETTNQLGLTAGDRMVYGNWNDLVLLDWAGIDVVVNPYSQDAQGIVTITVTLWTDSGLRHEVSFAVSVDSAAQ